MASDNFELVPLQQLQELREELARIKETPLPSPKKLEISLDEVAGKLDKLIAIFEDAAHHIKREAGDVGFTERFQQLEDKVEKVLDQNKEIAKGIIALAEMVQKKPAEPEPRPIQPLQTPRPPMPPMGGPKLPPPLFGTGQSPPGPQGMIPPPPDMPRKKGMFR